MSNEHTSIQEARNAILAIDAESTADGVLTYRGLVDSLKEQVRELDALMKEKMAEWMEVNGQISAGTVRYYLGVKKDTKCVDARQTVESVFTATGGDMDAFTGLLVSQPFKPGAAREVLDADTYARLFVTEEKPEIKEGKPVKSVQKIDTAFTR
jgi:hypothetical protein